MIKKSLIALVLVFSLIFVVGCIDYKSYDKDSDADLVKEIENLEKDLQLENESVVEEEVVLPDLEEEPKNDTSTEDDVQVITVNENELVRLKVTVTDPDEDNVTYTFTDPVNNNGEWQTNYGDAGEYLVTLSATDGLLSTEKKLKIMVNRVNVAPTIDGVRDIRAKEGEVITFEPVVNDPNNDQVTVTISDPLKSGTFATDHTSSGEYKIKVSATDGELTTEKEFSLTIENVNELPVISNVKDITVKEGEVVKIEPEVSDLDNDDIVLTISDPVGSDGVWETKYTSNGRYVITIVADDGQDKVTQRVTVVVEDVNKAPEIVDVSLATS